MNEQSLGMLYPRTVPAEQSLHLIPGLFGFDWVATECKLSLIMSCNVLKCYVAPPVEMSLSWVAAELKPKLQLRDGLLMIWGGPRAENSRWVFFSPGE